MRCIEPWSTIFWLLRTPFPNLRFLVIFRSIETCSYNSGSRTLLLVWRSIVPSSLFLNKTCWLLWLHRTYSLILSAMFLVLRCIRNVVLYFGHRPPWVMKTAGAVSLTLPSPPPSPHVSIPPSFPLVITLYLALYICLLSAFPPLFPPSLSCIHTSSLTPSRFL